MEYKKISQLPFQGGNLLDSHWVEIEDPVKGHSTQVNGAQLRAVEKGERVASINQVVNKIGLNVAPPYNIPDLSYTNYLGDTTNILQGLVILDGKIKEINNWGTSVGENETLPIEIVFEEETDNGNIVFDVSKVDHNQTLNYEPDRHRKMNYDPALKSYLIKP